jgi:hypothetical protein
MGMREQMRKKYKEEDIRGREIREIKRMTVKWRGNR